MTLRIGQTEQPYITPIQTPYLGFAVAVPRPDAPSEYVRKNFFGADGDLDKYLAAAIRWRDEKYAELHGKPIPERVFHQQQQNSNTGIAGVSRVNKTVKKKRKDGSVKTYVVPCIVALVHTIPGKDYVRASGARTRVFSIAKYGEEEALRLAAAWRIQMTERLAQGDTIP